MLPMIPVQRPVEQNKIPVYLLSGLDCLSWKCAALNRVMSSVGLLLSFLSRLSSR